MDTDRARSGQALLEAFPSEAAEAPASFAPPDPKLRKRDRKRLFATSRPLDAWERYRALNDAMDEVYKVIDTSNREARFALLVMGILNAFVVVSASRAEVVAGLIGAPRVVAATLLGIYAVAAVYFLFQAISVLHPGHFRPVLGDWTPAGGDFPRGLRYYEDVIERDVHSHFQAWCDVEMGQLNAELAVQLHSLCLKSNVKRLALMRLFAGLRVMTLLVGGLMALFLYAIWI